MEEQIKPVDILLVDDNDDDILIVKMVFKKARVVNKLCVAKGGQDALDFLYHQGKYAEEKPSAPGLILLDISMPKITGFDIIKKLKADPNLKKIPIIMLTASSDEEDIANSYESGAFSYITKPLTFDGFVKVIERFKIHCAFVQKTQE